MSFKRQRSWLSNVCSAGDSLEDNRHDSVAEHQCHKLSPLFNNGEKVTQESINTIKYKTANRPSQGSVRHYSSKKDDHGGEDSADEAHRNNRNGFGPQKTLRLFGVELTLPSYQMVNDEQDQDESNADEDKGDSSSVVQSAESGSNIMATSKNGKIECQFCRKAFANTQALGGHQNAHKKERHQAKRAQIQANSSAAEAAAVAQECAAVLNRAGNNGFFGVHDRLSVSVLLTQHSARMNADVPTVAPHFNVPVITPLPHVLGYQQAAPSHKAAFGSAQQPSRPGTIPPPSFYVPHPAPYGFSTVSPVNVYSANNSSFPAVQQPSAEDRYWQPQPEPLPQWPDFVSR